MCSKSKKHAGFLLTEIVVSLTILGILLAGLAVSLDGFRRFNRYQLVRQRCIAAAQAQLDSITATSGPIPDQDFKRLWPKLSVSIEKSPGAGQWQGLKLVKVTTSSNSFHRKVKVQFTRYILVEQEQ